MWDGRRDPHYSNQNQTLASLAGSACMCLPYRGPEFVIALLAWCSWASRLAGSSPCWFTWCMVRDTIQNAAGKAWHKPLQSISALEYWWASRNQGMVLNHVLASIIFITGTVNPESATSLARESSAGCACLSRESLWKEAEHVALAQFNGSFSEILRSATQYKELTCSGALGCFKAKCKT